MNGIPDSGLNTTQRGVRTQYDKLIEDFVKKEREEKKATGIDADYDELDQLLNDSYERASDAAEDLARQAEEKEKAECDEKQQAEDISLLQGGRVVGWQGWQVGWQGWLVAGLA